MLTECQIINNLSPFIAQSSAKVLFFLPRPHTIAMPEEASAVAPVIDNQHWLIKDAKRWYSDSARLVSKCTKPDYEGEDKKSTRARGSGITLYTAARILCARLNIIITEIYY